MVKMLEIPDMLKEANCIVATDIAMYRRVEDCTPFQGIRELQHIGNAENPDSRFSGFSGFSLFSVFSIGIVK